MLLAALLGAVAPAGGQEAPFAVADYQIGPRDLLRITVSEVPQLNGDRRVTEQGTINLPVLGELDVGGLTARQATARLKEILEARYTQRATVDIQVREFRSRPISVIGSVGKPGPLAFSGRWTLLEALTAAGGLSSGHGGTIYILRRADNGLSDQLAVSVDDLLIRGDPKANVPVFPNDLINVPTAVSVTVYCLGAVERPGAITFTSAERVTVLTAIARAGGLSDRASNKIVLRRADAQEEMRVDFKRILTGKEPDVELRSGDVLVVKESFL